MSGYRVYFMNARNHIVRAIELCCQDDEAASAEARNLAGGQIVEVWERARLVARLEPASDGA